MRKGKVLDEASHKDNNLSETETGSPHFSHSMRREQLNMLRQLDRFMKRQIQEDNERTFLTDFCRCMERCLLTN